MLKGVYKKDIKFIKTKMNDYVSLDKHNTFLFVSQTRQKIDSSVSVVSSSNAFMPITELPLALRRGDHTATE